LQQQDYYMCWVDACPDARTALGVRESVDE
ncbi:unnamed protein product, partial [marine sediment metagenome]